MEVPPKDAKEIMQDYEKLYKKKLTSFKELREIYYQRNAALQSDNQSKEPQRSFENSSNSQQY
jgi:hypothetical protein